MSLYSALTQVLAPFAAKIKGIQTGYDGTEYDSPGEAVREQINDLHVLIGDVPGTAIQASAVAYNDSDVGTELTNVNGRLQELHETIYKEIVDEKSGTYSATAGSPIPSQTHLVDVSIPNGAAYKFVLHADGIVSKYGLYANGTAVQYSLIPETEYELTAATDITWLSIYTTADFVTGSGTVTGVVTTTTLNENSLESKVESVGEETINALTNPFELSTADLEDGAIQNGTGIDFASQRRVRTKTYIPATKGTVITCTRGINVWEYDLLTKQYLTDYGDFTYSYTVENDCCIRIMWNAVKTTAEDYTCAELIALTTLGLMTLRNPLIDQSFIKELAVNVVSDEVVFRSQKSNTVKTIAHRGDDILAPQCTAPAYILARKHGHDIAENDLWLSEDGEFVMWHDTSLTRLGNMVDINGYLMYTDGTDYYWVHPTTNAVYTWNGSDYVSSGVALSGLDRCNGTYYGVNSQYSVTGLPLSILKRIDFGVYKGAKFAGTQILTFAEWVLLCKQLGMEIYIDRKLTYTDALLTQAANIVKRYGMGDYASWLGLTTSQITLLRSIIPDSRCGILQHPTAATVQSYQSYNVGRGFFFNGDAKNGMTAETIQIGLNAGFDVEVWYVDYGTATKEQVFDVLRSAVQYGVTGITTDHYRTDESFDFLFDTM